MNACSVGRCAYPVYARTLCSRHYKRAYYEAGNSVETMPPLDAWVNPLVCVCAVPDAHPRINFGMCQLCSRKPLSLFTASAL